MKHPIRHMWSGLAFIASAGLLILILQKFEAARWDEVTAAWMQAIGSVAAIIVAVGLAYFQQVSDRKKRAREVEDRRHERLGLVRRFATALHDEIKASDPSYVFFDDTEIDFDRQALGRLLAAFESIPLHELGDGEVSFQMWLTQDSARKFDRAMDWMAAELEHGADTGEGPNPDYEAKFHERESAAIVDCLKLQELAR